MTHFETLLKIEKSLLKLLTMVLMTLGLVGCGEGFTALSLGESDTLGSLSDDSDNRNNDGNNSANAPTITFDLNPTVTIKEGSDLSLSVLATGSPIPTFTWYKNNLPLAGFKDRTTGSFLKTLSVSSDSGSYYVVAKNSVGEVRSSTVQVTVSPAATTGGAPVITSNLSGSVTISSGQKFYVSVVATGSPTPTYTWYKNGVIIPNWEVVSAATYGKGSISNSDAGVYHVVVSNIHGSVTSGTIELVVGSGSGSPTPSAPKITSNLGGVVMLAEGERKTLSVEVSGYPAPIYSWYKNGIAIANYQDVSNGNYPLTGDLVKDPGSYHVVIFNSEGSIVSDTVEVRIQSGSVTMDDIDDLPADQQGAGRFIHKLYTQLLNRSEIDQAGFKYWMSRIDLGDSCGDVADGFITAGMEGVEIDGAIHQFPTNNVEFVGLLNDGLLSDDFKMRTEEQNKLAAILGGSGNGNMSRYEAWTLFRSSLGFQKMCEQDFGLNFSRVTVPSDRPSISFLYALYRNLFEREPDVGGLVFWMNEIELENSLCKSVASEFIKAGAQTGAFPQNSETFVRGLYLGVAGRIADTSGLKYWTAKVNSSNNWESVGLGFLEQLVSDVGETAYNQMCH